MIQLHFTVHDDGSYVIEADWGQEVRPEEIQHFLSRLQTGGFEQDIAGAIERGSEGLISARQILIDASAPVVKPLEASRGLLRD